MNALLLWDPAVDAELKTLAAAGVRSVRADLAWAEVEPARGRWDWVNADRMMRAAAQHDVDIFAILGYSAPWASSDPAAGLHHPPRNTGDYANFVSRVLQRYGSTGTFWRDNPALDPQPIRAIQLWNEPHGHWFWEPNPDPAAYGALVRAASIAARAVDPSVKIAIDGQLVSYRTNGQVPWLATLIEVVPEILTYVDVFTTHPYPDPKPQAPWHEGGDPRYGFKGRVTGVRDVLDAAGASHPIWVTEIGWCTGAGTCGDVDERSQAQMLGWALDWLAESQYEAVDRVYVYTWDRRGGPTSDWTDRFGLRRPDGSTTPAWREVASRLSVPGGTAVVPDAPSNVALSKDDRARTATMTWSAPSHDGGSAVTGYRLTSTVVGSVTPTSTSTVSSATRTHTFASLAPGTSYTVAIHAINAVGTGPVVTRSVSLGASIPTAPMIGKATSGVSGGKVTATVKWSAPASTGGSSITGYRVTAYQMGSSGAVVRTSISSIRPPASRSYSMNLPTRANYLFVVQAVNAVGAGPHSQRSNLVAGR